MRGSPRGFSLLEVIAATVLLGILASGLVLASARLRRQEAFMTRKRQAVALADRLISGGVTASGQEGAFRWTLTRESAPALLDTQVAQYRLAVFAAGDPAGPELTGVSFTRMLREGTP